MSKQKPKNKISKNKISGKNQGKVGKYHPPKEHQFKPGQSGNLKGKPKGTISLTLIIKRRLQELTPDGKRQAIEMLADNMIQDALDSSDNMRKLIWNYLDGLPKQSLGVDLTSKGKEILTSKQIDELFHRRTGKTNPSREVQAD